MRTAGIICEYNPFHRGHGYQLRQVRALLGRDTGIVCLMSGSFVQRGEPAIYDKFLRAAMALEAGANLVLELPMTGALGSAGDFADRAVGYLSRLGQVDYLCFGSEGPGTEEIMACARYLETEEFQQGLREHLASGVSFARARALAAGRWGYCLQGPNSSLGVDYCRGILRRGRAMEPVALGRDMEIPSATEERQRLLTGQEKPLGMLHSLEFGERAMLGVLRSLPEERFQTMALGSEGLWRKIYRACREENTVEEIILACKSKRYAYARLRRGLMCLVLGLGQREMALESPYLRVLGFDEGGREILHQGKRETSLVAGPVPRSREAGEYEALEERAARLYPLFAREPEPWRPDKGRRPIIYDREKNLAKPLILGTSRDIIAQL